MLVCCVGLAVSADWCRRSIRQYEAIVKLESGGGGFIGLLEHEICLTEQGKVELGSTPLSGVKLMLTKVFDHRVVCTVPGVLFLNQPDEGDLELVKQLKGVEILRINTQDEALLNEWKRELPDVDVLAM